MTVSPYVPAVSVRGDQDPAGQLRPHVLKCSKCMRLHPENSDGNGCHGDLQDKIQVVLTMFAYVEPLTQTPFMGF